MVEEADAAVRAFLLGTALIGGVAVIIEMGLKAPTALAIYLFIVVPAGIAFLMVTK